jgi:hypothetical protein
MITALLQSYAPSNMPGLQYLLGFNLAGILGPDTTIIGVFGLLCFIILWAYVGAGFEAGAVIFAGLIAILSVTGYLPIWVGYIEALALGLLVVKIFASTKW